MSQWIDELRFTFRERLVLNEPLSYRTTYRIGGPAEAAVFPVNAGELRFCLDVARKRGVRLTILGLGSNVLADDAGLDGIVVFTTGMAAVSVTDSFVEAQCGAPLDKAVESSVRGGLSGMEMLSGIPGTVGGAVYMNAGAFNQETFDRLVGFSALTPEGREVVLKKADVKPAYRHVEGLENLIILSAKWELTPGKAEELAAARRDVLNRRAEKQPLEFPSAGSVFKRPKGDFASRLIDSAGLKGLSVGGAKVSEKHAGFIINAGGATAADVRGLMRKVQDEVKARSGVSLELEQIILRRASI